MSLNLEFQGHFLPQMFIFITDIAQRHSLFLRNLEFQNQKLPPFLEVQHL